MSNPSLFELLTGLGDPSSAIRSGAMAAREKLSIYVAPASGSAPRLIFTGCLPGVSDQEQASVNAGQSGAQNGTDWFLGNRAQQEAEQEQAGFYGAVLAAMSTAAGTISEQGSRSRGFVDGSLLASLTSVRRLTPEGGPAARLFILTDLGAFAQDGDIPTARTAGFEDARTSGLRLGGVEVYLVGTGAPQGGSAREYADAFFLGAQGDLLSWGGAAFNALTAAPVESRDYVGEIAYPHDRFPMTLRVTSDSEGRLVNSWIVITSDAEWATPVSGSLSCSGGECRLTNDQSGLAQAWSTDPDPDPEFLATMPLSGLRAIQATITDEDAEGAISDPMVSIFEGAPDGFNALRFELSRRE